MDQLERSNDGRRHNYRQDVPGDATNVNIAVSLEIGGTEMQTVSKFYDTGNNLLSTHNATIQNNGNTGFSVPSMADTMTVDVSS